MNRDVYSPYGISIGNSCISNVSMVPHNHCSVVCTDSEGRKLRQAATHKGTIIAIIGKLSPIRACGLAIHVPSELDLSIQVGLGIQHAMPDT